MPTWRKRNQKSKSEPNKEGPRSFSVMHLFHRKKCNEETKKGGKQGKKEETSLYDLAEWAKAAGVSLDQEQQESLLCTKAAETGNLEAIKALRAKNHPWNEWTVYAAARNGHIEVTKWLMDNHCPWDKGVVGEAAMGGQLKMLEWLVGDLHLPLSEICCLNAASNGDIETLKWLRAHNCPWNSSVSDHAAEAGQVELLKWAVENGAPWSRSALKKLSDNHKLDIDLMKWAKEHNCAWDPFFLFTLAKNKMRDELEWAVENGCPWDQTDCSVAAQVNDFEMLKWMHEHGCGWNSAGWEFIYAWNNSNTEILTWLLEKGCDNPATACKLEFTKGSPEVFEWMKEKTVLTARTKTSV